MEFNNNILRYQDCKLKLKFNVFYLIFRICIISTQYICQNSRGEHSPTKLCISVNTTYLSDQPEEALAYKTVYLRGSTRLPNCIISGGGGGGALAYQTVYPTFVLLILEIFLTRPNFRYFSPREFF